VLTLFGYLLVKAEPLEIWRQYKDNQRKNDLQGLMVEVNRYIKYNSGGRISLGLVGKVYESSDGITSIDGSGWLPINFKSSGLEIKSLPLDPINQKDFIFTYSVSSDLKYKLTTKFESKYFSKLHSQDGGFDDTRFEIGTDLGLKP